jgi:uncharacterized DUF497 family protein
MKRKAASNFRKHAVSFDEAREVFTDVRGLEYYDEEHSDNEERWIRIGRASKKSTIVVSYTWRRRGGVSTARIISARYASRKEHEAYLAQD